MKILVLVSRILVGSLFIVSGLVKANDPLGFSYKLEEYFSPRALGILDFMEPYALAVAIFVCVAEIALGIALLIGGKAKLSAWISLLMILFFTWLTFYTASCDPNGTYIEEISVELNSESHEALLMRMEESDKLTLVREADGKAIFNEEMGVDCVTDCGCFGDAIKLTPWQSFSKDVVLLVFVLIIFIGRNKITLNELKEDYIVAPASLLFIALFSGGYIGWWFPLIFTAISYAVYMLIKQFVKHKQLEWILAVAMFGISAIFTYYCLWNLPIKDFRPYAVGKNIPEQMILPEGAPQDIYETRLVYKNKQTGESKEFTMENYPWQDTATWAWESTENVLVFKGDEPAIKDMAIMDEAGVDVTSEWLESPDYTFLLIAYDLEESDTDVQAEINKFAEDAMMDGKRFLGLTASLYDITEDFRHDNQTPYKYFTGDGITYKTMIRSNPGLILIKDGEVLGKWHHNNFPTYDNVKSDYF